VSRLAERNRKERAIFIQEAAARLGILPVIVEKDYWVCWLLGKIFADPRWEPHLVFKGGTSLSKVFNAIQRFSEDIDLSVSPLLLGHPEKELDEAPSKSMRQKRFKQLQTACAEIVNNRLRGDLEAVIRNDLGRRSDGGEWFRYEVDPRTDSPVLWFDYEATLPAAGGYIVPAVKLEFGSLTDQRPVGRHAITSMLADALPELEEERNEVVAMEVERTFWEKATILHAEYYRPAIQPIGERFSRHYSDLAALWTQPAGAAALARLDLLGRVALFKSRFFGSSWANYNDAKPGSLRLVPPPHREVELRQDYAKMEPMFLVPPVEFQEVIETLREAEASINVLGSDRQEE
jgi:hypothetical protein